MSRFQRALRIDGRLCSFDTLSFPNFFDRIENTRFQGGLRQSSIIVLIVARTRASKLGRNPFWKTVVFSQISAVIIRLLFDILTYKIVFFSSKNVANFHFSLPFLRARRRWKFWRSMLGSYEFKNVKPTRNTTKINHLLHRVSSKYVYLESFQFSLLFILPMISSNRARHIDHHRLYVEKMWNYRS